MDKGRELRADYKIIARALTRKANALVKQGKLETAIGVYQKSLTEHRCAGLCGGWGDVRGVWGGGGGGGGAKASTEEPGGAPVGREGVGQLG